MHHGDTGNTAHGNGTGGSRGLAVGGAALVVSLEKIKDKAVRIAAHKLEAAVEDIELESTASTGSRACRPADSPWPRSRRLPTAAACRRISTPVWRRPTSSSPADETFPFGTHIAVVEVFPETGEVKLLRYVSVDDCRQHHQPDAGDRPGPRRARAGHRPGALGRDELRRQRRAVDRHPERLRGAEGARLPAFRDAPHHDHRPRSTRSGPRASARRRPSAPPRPPPTR